MTALESPFDPFTFDDNKDDGQAPTPAGALTINQQSTKGRQQTHHHLEDRQYAPWQKLPRQRRGRLDIFCCKLFTRQPLRASGLVGQYLVPGVGAMFVGGRSG